MKIAYCKTAFFCYDSPMVTHDFAPKSPATQTLRNINFMLHLMSHDIAHCDVAMLEAIASTASQIAQDLRVEHDRVMAQFDELEALAAERLMAESDALDHQIA